MMAALPDKAPATPRQARKVLVLGKAAGFVHSSIPLAARTVEELGKKTGAWSTTITYDPADIDAQNLKQYDAVFLDSTTGAFLDAPTIRRRPTLVARRCSNSCAAAKASRGSTRRPTRTIGATRPRVSRAQIRRRRRRRVGDSAGAAEPAQRSAP